MEDHTLFQDKTNINKMISSETSLHEILTFIVQTIDKHSFNRKLFSELYKAIEREEFEIYYQPYFGVEKRKLGMEALIRWNHPQYGLLAPASFLTLAEETGLIFEIEQWVLSQSIQQVKQLHQNERKDVTLSVNISAQQLGKQDFPNKIYELLNQHSFSPKNLTLEITERFLIEKHNIIALNHLKDLGVRISIDDFGASSSSLQYLKDFEVDEIKIDRSFISNLETNFNSQKIVEMLIILGHQLNLEIVAEGVETDQQLELLKAMKCDMVQGFLFSEPIPFKEFEKNYFQKSTTFF